VGAAGGKDKTSDPGMGAGIKIHSADGLGLKVLQLEKKKRKRKEKGARKGFNPKTGGSRGCAIRVSAG